MNTLLVSSSLNSFPLNSSQIFSTHLTLSIRIHMMFLKNLMRVTRKSRAVAQAQKKSAPGRALFMVRRGCAGLQHQSTSPASGWAAGFSTRVASKNKL